MRTRFSALAAGLALSLSCALSQAADVLRVSAIPDEAPTELQRKFKPLGAYLEQQLGMKVEFVPVSPSSSRMTHKSGVSPAEATS